MIRDRHDVVGSAGIVKQAFVDVSDGHALEVSIYEDEP